MGDHYATCRPENCGQCGQALGYCEHTAPRRKSAALDKAPTAGYWISQIGGVQRRAAILDAYRRAWPDVMEWHRQVMGEPVGPSELPKYIEEPK